MLVQEVSKLVGYVATAVWRVTAQLKLNTASALQPRSRSDAPRAPPTLPAGQSSRPKRPHVRAVWSGAILHRRFLSRMPTRWKAELLGQRGTLPLFLQF